MLRFRLKPCSCQARFNKFASRWEVHTYADLPWEIGSSSSSCMPRTKYKAAPPKLEATTSAGPKLCSDASYTTFFKATAGHKELVRFRRRRSKTLATVSAHEQPAKMVPDTCTTLLTAPSKHTTLAPAYEASSARSNLAGKPMARASCCNTR